MRRSLVSAGLVILGVVLTPELASADAVLTDTASPSPTLLDLEAAVAVTPFGSTRWSRITFEGPHRIWWVLPARPGAAVDRGGDAWLAALDDATTPRLRLDACAPRLDRVTSWNRGDGVSAAVGTPNVAMTESVFRDQAAASGFRITPALDAPIAALYARGWVLISFEVTAPGAGRATSPTMRVSDDGSGTLPFALTPDDRSDTHVTAFTITPNPVTVAGATEIATATDVTDYVAERTARLAPGGWVREASSHEVLFDDAGPDGAPIARTYLGDAACESMARSAGVASGTVGRPCAPGLVAQVAGPGCAPTTGVIDVAALVCGANHDLALALAGTHPGDAFVGRFSGRPAPGAASDVGFLPGTARSPILASGTSAGCGPAPSPAPVRQPMMVPTPVGGAAPIVVAHEGCGSGDTRYQESESCGAWIGGLGSSDDPDESSSDVPAGAPSGDAVDDGDKGDNGDTAEPDPGDSDGDSSDDDSSGDSSDDDDVHTMGVTIRAMKSRPGHAPHHRRTAPATKRLRDGATSRHVSQPQRSPVSRAALFLGALVLPLRRRKRT